MKWQGRAFRGSLGALALAALAGAQGERLNEPFTLPGTNVPAAA